MNTSPKIFVVLLIVFIAVALLDAANAKPPPVTLTVTPSVISNTYPGVITLNITSLTNTENVTIQRWLDLNGNGSIDAGEPMIDAFKITDNNITNALIGGITNINVPFDTNPAIGAITTTLNCPAAMLFDTIVGQYVFQVVSPSGRFSPVTATFAVTNATPGQSVSGIIYSNDIPFPHAVVVAKNQLADGGAAAGGRQQRTLFSRAAPRQLQSHRGDAQSLRRPVIRAVSNFNEWNVRDEQFVFDQRRGHDFGQCL